MGVDGVVQLWGRLWANRYVRHERLLVVEIHRLTWSSTRTTRSQCFSLNMVVTWCDLQLLPRWLPFTRLKYHLFTMMDSFRSILKKEKTMGLSSSMAAVWRLQLTLTIWKRQWRMLRIPGGWEERPLSRYRLPALPTKPTSRMSMEPVSPDTPSNADRYFTSGDGTPPLGTDAPDTQVGDGKNNGGASVWSVGCFANQFGSWRIYNSVGILHIYVVLVKRFWCLHTV